MSNAKTLRKQLLELAPDILEEIQSRVLGKSGKYPKADAAFLNKYWDALIPIIQGSDDPTPLTKLTDGDITQRVDAVLSEVASGVLTPAEGKKLIGLLQAGFDITELPALIERLSDLEKA